MGGHANYGQRAGRRRHMGCINDPSLSCPPIQTFQWYLHILPLHGTTGTAADLPQRLEKALASVCSLPCSSAIIMRNAAAGLRTSPGFPAEGTRAKSCQPRPSYTSQAPASSRQTHDCRCRSQDQPFMVQTSRGPLQPADSWKMDSDCFQLSRSSVSTR